MLNKISNILKVLIIYLIMNEKNEGNIPLKDRIDDNEEIDVKDQNDNKEQSSRIIIKVVVKDL